MVQRVAGVGNTVIFKLAKWFSGGRAEVTPELMARLLGHSYTDEALTQAGVSPQERQQALKEGFLVRGDAGFEVNRTAANNMRRAMSKNGSKRQASPPEYDHDTGGWLLTSDLGESGHSTAIDDDQQPVKSGSPHPTMSPTMTGAISTLDEVATAVASVDRNLARRLKALSREASSRIAMGVQAPPMGNAGPAMGGMAPTMGGPSPDDIYSTAVFTREDEELCGPPNDANQSRKFKHEIWERFPANESQLGPKPKPERNSTQGPAVTSNLPAEPSGMPVANKRQANPCPYPEFINKLSKATDKVKKLGKDRYKANEMAFHRAEKAIDQALRQAAKKSEKKCPECGKKMSQCECGSGKKAARRRAGEMPAPIEPMANSPTALPTPRAPVQVPGMPLPVPAAPAQNPNSPTALPTPRVPVQRPAAPLPTPNAPAPNSPTALPTPRAPVQAPGMPLPAPAGVVGGQRKASVVSPWDSIKKNLKRVASGGGHWNQGEWDVTPADYGKTLDLNVNTRLADGTPLVASTVSFTVIKEDKKGRTATVEVHDSALHHKTRELRIPLDKAKLFAQEWARNTERVAKACLKGD